MKRTITTLILLILLTTPLILAAEDTTEPTGEQITDQAKEGLSALRGGLDIKTENVLERQVNFPPIIKTPLKLILGLEEDATWQRLIIILGVFIGFFILIFSITDFLPFFKKGPVKVLASLIITALVSITGALDAVAEFFFWLSGLFKWTASWGPLQMIVAILIAAAVIITFNKVANKIKNKIKIEEAGETGKKIQEGSESAEIFSEAQKELAK